MYVCMYVCIYSRRALGQHSVANNSSTELLARDSKRPPPVHQVSLCIRLVSSIFFAVRPTRRLSSYVQLTASETPKNYHVPPNKTKHTLGHKTVGLTHEQTHATTQKKTLTMSRGLV
jgi:hypothetical protein